MIILNLPTRSIVGHYLIHSDIIEISSLLPKDAYEFVLRHEKTHAEIFHEHGLYTWRHFTLDLKDRYKIYTNIKLYRQMFENKEVPFKQELKEFPFKIVYALFGVLTGCLAFI